MTIEEQMEGLDNSIHKNEKLSWKRKQKVIEKLVADLEPLEDEILKLMAKKAKMVDKITATRTQMVQECIHPTSSLVGTEDETLFCKFCNRELNVIVSSKE